MRHLAAILSAFLLFFLCGTSSLMAFDTGSSKYANYEGMLVHYTDMGAGGPVLVFVHGWACNQEFWKYQAEVFSESHRILLIDLPGHGESGKPKVDYTLPFFGRAVLAVMEHAGVDKAVLLGHSMGFPVIREAWRGAPERVLALVSVDGALNDVPDDPEARIKWEEGLREFLKGFADPGYEKYVRNFVGSMHNEQTPVEIREWVISEMLETPHYVGRSAMHGFADPAVWKRDSVEVPVLAVYADMPWLTEDHVAGFRALCPKLTFRRMSGVGHFLMLEKPDELNGHILEFLDSL